MGETIASYPNQSNSEMLPTISEFCRLHSLYYLSLWILHFVNFLAFFSLSSRKFSLATVLSLLYLPVFAIVPDLHHAYEMRILTIPPWGRKNIQLAISNYPKFEYE